MSKALIFLLAGVVILFALAIGVGVSRDDASPNPADHGWARLFEFGGAPSVGAEDVASSDCFAEAAQRFQVSGTSQRCLSEIRESGDRARLLRVEVLQASATVRVSLQPHDSDGIELSGVRLEQGESTSASVGRAGATLTLDCPGGCVVGLARE